MPEVNNNSKPQLPESSQPVQNPTSPSQVSSPGENKSSAGENKGFLTISSKWCSVAWFKKEEFTEAGLLKKIFLLIKALFFTPFLVITLPTDIVVKTVTGIGNGLTTVFNTIVGKKNSTKPEVNKSEEKKSESKKPEEKKSEGKKAKKKKIEDKDSAQSHVTKNSKVKAKPFRRKITKWNDRPENQLDKRIKIKGATLYHPLAKDQVKLTARGPIIQITTNYIKHPALFLSC